MKTKSSNASLTVQTPAFPLPVFPGGALLGTLQKSGGLLSRAWNWLQERRVVRSCTRRLHVAATASLGEKRFVALVQMDGLEFLVGGGASNVVLLAQLNAKEHFNNVLQDSITTGDRQPASRTNPRLANPAMRPKVERLINSTAKKIVKPAIEQFIRPAVKNSPKKVVKPVEATPARTMKTAPKPVAKRTVERVKEPIAKKPIKLTRQPVKLVAKTAPKQSIKAPAMPMPAAKPPAKKPAKQIAKAAPKQLAKVPAKQIAKTPAKRMGKRA